MAASSATSARRPGASPGARLAIHALAAALMVLPVLAIRIAEDSPSDPGDFVFLAILFAGLFAAVELAARVPDRAAYRAATAIAAAAWLIEAWINLAVGTIGSEDNPANLIYAAVLVVPLAGAAAARLRPRAMAFAMAAAALAQLAAFVVALAAGLGFTGPITVFFAGLWLVSASLFRRSAAAKAAA